MDSVPCGTTQDEFTIRGQRMVLERTFVNLNKSVICRQAPTVETERPTFMTGIYVRRGSMDGDKACSHLRDVDNKHR